MSSDARSAKFPAAVILLMAIHAAVAIFLAVKLNIWVDEASTLYATSDGLGHAIRTAVSEQKQAPLYFWALSVWRYVDCSIFFARLFSIACSLGAVAVLWSIVRTRFTQFQAIAITAFAALHPFLFWASTEIRVYSMVVLLSAALVRLFLDEFYSERTPKWRASTFLFPLVAITGLYTNYYFGFLLAGCFAALIITRRWDRVARFILMMTAAGIAFLPLALTIGGEMQARNSGYHDPRSVVEGVKIVWNHLLTFLLPTEIYTGPEVTIASMVRIWIVRIFLVMAAAAALLKRDRIQLETLAMGTVAATAAAMLVAANMLVGPSLIVIRHASVLFVPVVIFFAMLVRDLTADVRMDLVRPALGFATLVLAFFIYGTVSLYPSMIKRGDWTRASDFIEANESPGQPIVVFPAYDALVPRYEYGGTNRILPERGFFEFMPEAPSGSAERHRSEISAIIAAIPPDAKQIWLSMSDWCGQGDNCAPLQRYIDANYTVVAEREFYLQRLYLLERKTSEHEY